MSNFTIEIKAPELVVALSQLAAAIMSGKTSGLQEAPAIPAQPQQSAPAPMPAQPEYVPAPVAVAAPITPVQAMPAAPIAAAPAFVLDDLARAASALMDAGKQPELVALLH